MEKPVFFKKYFIDYKWVWFFALLVALGAAFFGWQRSDRFSVSQALIVSRDGTQAAADYKYDNYYAIKAGDDFCDTVAGFFKTPEMTVKIYQRAGLEFLAKSLGSLAKRFDAEKIAPGIVEIRFNASGEAEGEMLAQAIFETAQEKIDQVSRASTGGISFVVVKSEPVIVKNNYMIWLNFLTGFLSGLAIGFFVRFAREYL